MNKLTAKEILEIVETNGVSEAEFAWGDFDLTEELGEWREVVKYGGEDQGSTWYSIKHFKDHDIYIRTDGYYQSYSGVEFDQGYGEEVRPKEKVVTVYE